MRFGKVIATVLAAGLLMNSLAGCGQAAKTKESSNTETTVQEQRTEEDIVTLKVFFHALQYIRCERGLVGGYPEGEGRCAAGNTSERR